MSRQTNQAPRPHRRLHDTNDHLDPEIGGAASYGPPAGTHFNSGPNVLVHPPYQRTPEHDPRAYGVSPRLPMPLEPRPPMHVDTRASGVGHPEATMQMYRPPLVLSDHTPSQRQWYDYSTPERQHFNRGISAPADGTIPAESPTSTYSYPSASPSNTYITQHAGAAPYVAPMRSSSADVYDPSQNTALSPGIWRSVAGSDSETAPTGSPSPSSIDGDSPVFSRGRVEEQGVTAQDDSSLGDSSPGNTSYSASESSESSPTRYSSIHHGVAPSRQSPASNSPTRTPSPRKNKMHTCTVCQKQFPRPSGLRTHMNTHTGAKRK